MTESLAPVRFQSEIRTRDGFVQLLRAEWTKFTSVRGWVWGAAGAALVIVVVGLLATASSNRDAGRNAFPTDSTGRAVDDSYYFVHQSLSGDGSITSQVQFSSKVQSPGPQSVVPWAKAGLIVKDGLQQGSPYAAIMVTGGHGVRFQDNYVNDTAGMSGGVQSPRWLRLTRSGDVITGYDSADGSSWARVGSVRLAGLPASVQVGLFAASPQQMIIGDGGSTQSPAVGVGTFTSTGLSGGWNGGSWSAEQVGGQGDAGSSGSYSEELSGGWTQRADHIVVTGAGDIAPVVGGTGSMLTLENMLVGGFAGLIVLIVVGCTFITAEYRTGMILTTLAASPRRGPMLVAKALVIGGVAFAVGIIGGFLSWLVGQPRAKSAGFPVLDVPPGVELRILLGTGLLMAAATVLALAVGALFRRSATAATLVIAMMILPYVLALSSVLPTATSQWLLRVTPAAGFAVQQSVQHYDQVLTTYTPSSGYYPLAPWSGFGVLGVYAVIVFGMALIVIQRRDAR